MFRICCVVSKDLNIARGFGLVTLVDVEDKCDSNYGRGQLTLMLRILF